MESYVLLVAGGVLLTLTLAYRLVVYPIFLSSLAGVPAAHPLCRLTPLWIKWQRLRGRELDVVARAFAEHGPYVRLGPGELATNAVEGVQSVYGVRASNFDKHASYEYFITQG